MRNIPELHLILHSHDDIRAHHTQAKQDALGNVHKYLILAMQTKAKSLNVHLIASHPLVSKCARRVFGSLIDVHASWEEFDLKPESIVCAWDLRYHPLHPVGVDLSVQHTLVVEGVHVAHVGTWGFVSLVLLGGAKNKSCLVDVRCGAIPAIKLKRQVF